MLDFISTIKLKSKVDQNYFIELTIFALCFLDYSPSDLSLALGSTVMFMALFLKLWLYSYPKRKNKKFEVYGPYRFVRFPHYLSTFLLCLGTVFLVRSTNIILLQLSLFLILYFIKTKSLDADREDQTGYEYTYYKGHVSALIPSVFPYPSNSTKQPRFRHVFDTRSKPEMGVIAISLFYVIYSYSFLNWSPLRGSHQIVVSLFILVLSYLMGTKIKVKRSLYDTATD